MNKEEFINNLIRKKEENKSKQEHLERIRYLEKADDSEYNKLKKELKTQIILEEIDDLEFLKDYGN